MTESLKQQELTDNEKINHVLYRIYRHQLRYDKKVAQLQNDFNRVYKQMQNCYKELNFTRVRYRVDNVSSE